MKKITTLITAIAIVMLTACFGDLDTVPVDKDLDVSETFYTDVASYKAVLAKIYAGLATTGQQGPAGSGDLGGIDEGFSNYIRQLWYQQELTTDEAVIAWNDQTIKDFHELDWTASDVFINAFYNRVFYQIGVCNEFLRQSSTEALDRRDASQEVRDAVVDFRNEARFMRALSYYHALDAFGNVPFVTEEDNVGAFSPEQIQAADLFDYVESELLELENTLLAPRTNEYARADRAAAWMVLAKLYLNAEVYVGQDRYADCLTYCKKILDAGYRLDDNFQHVFLADNHLSEEIIFPVAFDGQFTQTFGGTTFIIKASIGGDIRPADLGVNEGWGGIRVTPDMFAKFGAADDGTIIDFGQGDPGLKTLFMSEKVGGVFQTDFSDNQLASLSGTDVFEAYRYFAAGAEFVFKTTAGFGSKTLGDEGMNGTLEENATPIVVAEEGLYHIVVDRTSGTGTYSTTKVDVKATGSGIAGGETAFEFDTDTRLLKAIVEFRDGEVLISAGGLTLGGSSTSGVLAYDGDAIATVATPGEILLDLYTPEYTYRLASTSFDRRGLFGTQGQTLDIEDIADYKQGYAYLKFSNLDRNGNPGSNLAHPDTDFPLFRLADVYLMASECILRGAPGSTQEAVDYFNAVRSRAYKSELANLTTSTLTLQEIIDERARELMWEGHRRSDLIRFDQFTTDAYLWQWKGGVKEGRAVEAYRRLFPIPSADLNNNPNLEQNDGY